MLELNKIYNEDCLEGMKKIPDGSIDFICTDLPYGITDCEWDKRIPFEPMWEQFNRVTKENACIALFTRGKFQFELWESNKKFYRRKTVWVKTAAVGFLDSKKMPLRIHEDIMFFYRALPKYNPQFTYGKPYTRMFHGRSNNYGKTSGGVYTESPDGKRYPTDVIYFKSVNSGVPKNHQSNVLHSTQKPVELIEYLIKTYTDEGETVLDACMGSGTTAVAAVNTGRKFIGFELDERYFQVATERVQKRIEEKELELF